MLRQKKKVLRAYQPYMTKNLREAIMRRSALQKKHYRNKSPDTGKAYKKTEKLY